MEFPPNGLGRVKHWNLSLAFAGKRNRSIWMALWADRRTAVTLAHRKLLSGKVLCGYSAGKSLVIREDEKPRPRTFNRDR